jgi:hypothetical protein
MIAGRAAAATLRQPDAPLQVLVEVRARQDAGASGGPVGLAQLTERSDWGAVIVGPRARRLVRDAVVADAILTTRPDPAVPCADPGGAGLTLVTERAGGGLELISIVLRSLRGPSFDLAQLP